MEMRWFTSVGCLGEDCFIARYAKHRCDCHKPINISLCCFDEWSWCRQDWRTVTRCMTPSRARALLRLIRKMTHSSYLQKWRTWCHSLDEFLFCFLFLIFTGELLHRCCVIVVLQPDERDYPHSVRTVCFVLINSVLLNLLCVGILL